jgi:predicted Fe-Mo cluster-binding NifX family protein
MKIAVTTTDGNKVNQHFGKAENFYVFEIIDNNLKSIEVRGVEPYSKSGSDSFNNSDIHYSLDSITVIYNVIKDCDILYTQQIGEKPLRSLNELGISVKLCNCSVDSLINCEGKCS